MIDLKRELLEKLDLAVTHATARSDQSGCAYDGGYADGVSVAWAEARALIERHIKTFEEVLSQLDKTADGKYFTPKSELWQIDPNGFVHDGHAWPAGNGYSWQRVSELPVYSSEKAALASLNTKEEAR